MSSFTTGAERKRWDSNPRRCYPHLLSGQAPHPAGSLPNCALDRAARGKVRGVHVGRAAGLSHMKTSLRHRLHDLAEQITRPLRAPQARVARAALVLDRVRLEEVAAL